MDNRQIDLHLNGKKDFDLAMQLACSDHKSVKGWSIYQKEKFRHLVLHWCVPDGNTKINQFPFEMNTEQAISFAWGWLEKEPIAYSQPDHDGDNDRGFHIFNESWGYVNSDWSALIAIKPIWAMYGK